ncbi:MAG: hypothetical protein A3J54_01905 [Candidatus Ryanbacteria bacterium RIFCSPHIGHO2_02_FULL_45_13b]|uniref:PIN domain-containing protein n=1 Tax=Candidatus Ryanbacteria bacterium RIFCSPHIGHO2_02_FULL_45_13b TaxID=1802117 RepID=A0A1G2G9M5_9BACT|nr:MAG: hypothetical protein A3J54_01905 [Candidatus Ryanbacteria bacterium RIFCSPHIGHO2_02_FULL_45_13b]
MYTLDTNTIIYYVKGDERVVAVVEDMVSSDYPIYVSVLTEAELFSYSHLTDIETEHIDSLLRTVSIIPLDSRLARLAGMVRRMYKTKLADSIIASTALVTGSTLLTRNINDFKKIINLSLKRI